MTEIRRMYRSWGFIVLIALALVAGFTPFVYETLHLANVDWSKVDTGAIVVAIAAVVQAVAAAAIVWVTVQLRRTASDALITSAQQVAITQEATRLSRRDLQVASAPVLEVEQPYIDVPVNDKVVFSVTNIGDSPALGIVIEIAAADQHYTALEPARVAVKVGTLGPKKAHTIGVPMAPFKNVPNPQFPGRPRDARFSVDYMVVHFAHRGILGQQVHADYRWSANFENQDAEGVWGQIQQVVVTDVPDTEPSIIEFGR